MDKPSVQISTPCSEQWADMKLVEGSRFCGNCQKTVTDFTAMTDDEVMQVIVQHRGHACGRFRIEQLSRPLRTYSPVSYTPQRFWGLLAAGLLGWHTTQAQVTDQEVSNEKITVQPVANRLKHQSQPSTSSSVTQIDSSKVITGRVVAESNNSGLSGVFVTIKGITKGVITDSTGNFRLVIPAEYEAGETTLGASFIGFVRQEVSVKLNRQSPLLIALTEDSVLLGEVIVVGNYQKPSFLDRLRNRLPTNR